MTQGPTPFAQSAVQRAVERAGWLAEVAAALDQASRLTVALFDQAADRGDGELLSAQIRALRTEVDSIQRRRDADDTQPFPNWVKYMATDYTPSDKSPPPPNSAR